MMCAWQELLSILPPQLRADVDRQGRETIQELRLRIQSPPELVHSNGSTWLQYEIKEEDLRFVINTASRYSPWAAATTSKGYLTAPGGHRIGLCGETVCKDGAVAGFRNLYSLCIRVARDFPGIAGGIPVNGSVLILGAPGWGKTTLLRDLIRQISRADTVCVIDEREELFPKGYIKGQRMDLLSACPKRFGIDMALRTMGPAWIAVDEITEELDTRSVLEAANCGVRLMATAHAADLEDFHRRRVYRPLADEAIFETVLVLRKDKSFTVERTAL